MRHPSGYEGNNPYPFPQTPFVFAPNQKRIIECVAIHAYHPVYLIPGKGRRANNHALCQVIIPAAFGDLLRQPQVIGIELLQLLLNAQ